MKSSNRRPVCRSLGLLNVIAAVLIMSGCSELKMVNPTVPDEENRADVIRMSGIVADLTSSGTVQRRIAASSGTFSEGRGLLTMNDVRVDSFDTSGVKQGTTQAKTGRSYFQNQGERSRGDIEFTTDVLHTAPDKANPTTNAIEMKSNHVLWNDKEQRYESLTPYEMQIRAKGNPPLVLRGGGFHTTADMLKWNVIGGAMTTDPHKDLQAEREKMRAEMWDIAARADAENEKIAEQNKTRQVTTQLPPELQGEREPLPPGDKIKKPTTSTMPSTSITTGGRQVAKIPSRGPARTTTSTQIQADEGGPTSATRRVARIPGAATTASRTLPRADTPLIPVEEDRPRTARIPGPGGRRRPLSRGTPGTVQKAPRSTKAQSGNE